MSESGQARKNIQGLITFVKLCERQKPTPLSVVWRGGRPVGAIQPCRVSLPTLKLAFAVCPSAGWWAGKVAAQLPLPLPTTEVQEHIAHQSAGGV